MKVNLKLKIIISFIITLAMMLVIYQVMDQTPTDIATDEVIGEVHFLLYDESQSLVRDQRLDIYEDDTLYTLLNRHYDLVCANQQYQPDETCSYKFVHGYALLGVDQVVTDWHSTFLSIYVNEQLSTLGVSAIQLNDDDLIEIKVITDE